MERVTKKTLTKDSLNHGMNCTVHCLAKFVHDKDAAANLGTELAGQIDENGCW